jgi:hypothetical protein
MTNSGIRLSGFSLDVLDSAAPSQDWPAEETVERAVEHYLADRKLRPPGWLCLPLPEPQSEDRTRPAVQVNLAEPLLREIVEEAATQRVSIDVLVRHAVMYLWVAQRQQTGVPLAEPEWG